MILVQKVMMRICPRRTNMMLEYEFIPV
jgi:hypothetical protein